MEDCKQVISPCRQPHARRHLGQIPVGAIHARRDAVLVHLQVTHARQHRPGVAVQVEFEKHNFKPLFLKHLIGSRVETRRFRAMGQLNSTCTVPPWAQTSRA
jgi:hypothetical protein